MAAGDAARFLFWASVAAVLYTYAGYPLLISLLARLRGRPVRRAPPGTAEHPEVAIVLVVHNAEERIGARIENLLASDYPSDRVTLVVALDGCTDGTAAMAMRYAAGTPRVDCRVFDERLGKAAILDRVIPSLRQPIVVLCDVRQDFERSTIATLLESFADPDVGAVSGDLRLARNGDSAAGAGIRLYWEYEQFIRRAEALVHSSIGATGPIYAMRNALFVPLPAGTVVDDMVVALQVVMQGRRVVVDERARAYDGVARVLSTEFARKVRTLAGNFQTLVLLRRLLVPWRSPVALQFASHKLMRLVAPWLLLAALVTSGLLAGETPYGQLFAAQAGFYALGLAGWLAERRLARLGPIRLLLQIPALVLVLNAAAVTAAWAWLSGRQKPWWDSPPFSAMTPAEGRGEDARR